MTCMAQHEGSYLSHGTPCVRPSGGADRFTSTHQPASQPAMALTRHLHATVDKYLSNRKPFCAHVQGPGTPHDAEADADASDVWAKLGPQTEEGTSDPVPLSASELATLQDVDELPPAAAAVLYRTWDAVRTGSREMSEGRPLTRGGTASLHGQAAAAAARQLLASSGGLPPKSASRPRTGAPGTASGTRRPLTSGEYRNPLASLRC